MLRRSPRLANKVVPSIPVPSIPNSKPKSKRSSIMFSDLNMIFPDNTYRFLYHPNASSPYTFIDKMAENTYVPKEALILGESYMKVQVRYIPNQPCYDYVDENAAYTVLTLYFTIPDFFYTDDTKQHLREDIFDEDGVLVRWYDHSKMLNYQCRGMYGDWHSDWFRDDSWFNWFRDWFRDDTKHDLYEPHTIRVITVHNYYRA